MADRVLLLDVMDTLVHDPFYEEVLAFFSMTLDQLFAVKDKHSWQRFERGEIDEATMAAEYFSDRRPLDLDGLLATMRRSYRWLPGIEGLLGELRGRDVDMHAMSNYPSWWRMIEEQLELSRYLRWSFVSCETGVRKPAPEAYLGAAQTLAVDPSRCIFVDDREKNCAAARAVGMDAVRYESAEQLRSALVGLGVLA